MPSYDYRCVNGHSTELFRRMTDMEDAIACPECGEKAEMIFITPTQFRDAQPIDPVVVYRKRDGGYIYPGDSGPRDYPDAVRVELRTLGDLRRVAQDQDRQDRETWEMSRQAEEAHHGPFRAARRAQLRADLRTNFGLDLLRTAIEQNDQRRDQRRYTPGNFFEVAEMDRSNREPQYDRRTGWKARRE
jgi:putative FmdB family regulatory protein